MKVLRADMAAIFVALGYKTASPEKWNKKKMEKHLPDVIEMVKGGAAEVPDEVEDAERLNELLGRIADLDGPRDVELVEVLTDDEVETVVVEPDPVEPDEEETTEPQRGTRKICPMRPVEEPDGSPDEEEDAADADEADEEAAEPPPVEEEKPVPKPKAKKKGGRKKKAKPTAKKKGRLVQTRPYVAGKVINQHGLEGGVTDRMVEDLDRLYGKPNPAESRFVLRNAWHAVRGFFAKD